MMRSAVLLALCTGAVAIKPAASNVQLAADIKSTVQSNKDLIMMGVFGVVILCAIILAWKKFAPSSGYKTFGDKSGLSPSSSDITSSETGSTDRELKSRMERFEQRLEDHKKMLETRYGVG